MSNQMKAWLIIIWLVYEQVVWDNPASIWLITIDNNKEKYIEIISILREEKSVLSPSLFPSLLS